jgi:hypothetical protein
LEFKMSAIAQRKVLIVGCVKERRRAPSKST